MTEFEEFTKILTRVKQKSKEGETLYKTFTDFCNSKFLYKVCEEAFENMLLKMALTENTDFFKKILKNGIPNATKTDDSIQDFLNHMLLQFSTHLNCGETDIVNMALACMELSENKTMLKVIVDVIDSNPILKHAIVMVITLKANEYNSKRLYILPFSK